MKTYTEEREALLKSPAVSFWLKNAIHSLEKRDPVDAAHDADALQALMDLRVNEGDFDSENIYGLASIRQSIEEDRR